MGRKPKKKKEEKQMVETKEQTFWVVTGPEDKDIKELTLKEVEEAGGLEEVNTHESKEAAKEYQAQRLKELAELEKQQALETPSESEGEEPTDTETKEENAPESTDEAEATETTAGVEEFETFIDYDFTIDEAVSLISKYAPEVAKCPNTGMKYFLSARNIGGRFHVDYLSRDGEHSLLGLSGSSLKDTANKFLNAYKAKKLAE